MMALIGGMAKQSGRLGLFSKKSGPNATGPKHPAAVVGKDMLHAVLWPRRYGPLDAVMGRCLKGSHIGWLSLRMMMLETGSERSAPSIL
ncbi:hypothetical protein CLG96_07835 [Sphingomonas oleivorans]|uniref:Uncharacterized protein n=1 Tax=Sphingomonas oleivorans TaxID=1735121 RepID=A0A2T5FZ17_9SPHN|nr:hypothetical protein CLG96_07835 [Sphingomonas oleivorans]